MMKNFVIIVGTSLIQKDINNNVEEKSYPEEIKILEQQKEELSKTIKTLPKYTKYLWIFFILLIFAIPKTFLGIVFLIVFAIFILALPTIANENYTKIENTIRQKKIEYDNTQKKEKQEQKKELAEKEMEEQKLREEIESVTPFKSTEEATGYYIALISWELNDNDKLKSVSLMLKNQQKTKQLYFKYNGKGKSVNPPTGMWEAQFLRMSREKIKLLVKSQKYDEANELFREVFDKDPFTGEDITEHKHNLIHKYFN